MKLLLLLSFALICIFWAERAAAQCRYEVATALFALALISITLGVNHG
jgi:hypothetical protein